MKNLILISALLISMLSVSFANTTPENSVNIIDVAEVTVTVDNDVKDIFKVAELTKDMSSLKFVTNDNVQFVQIYNADGIVEFQLPVDSKNVKISKSFFETGKYKLGFKIDNDNEVYFAEVKMK